MTPDPTEEAYTLDYDLHQAQQSPPVFRRALDAVSAEDREALRRIIAKSHEIASVRDLTETWKTRLLG